MSIQIEQIKELRQLTGAGVLEVKQALETTGGNVEDAVALLREKGLAKAAKKAARTASEGHVVAYVHGDPGRIGVLAEVNCETDFVARTDEFRALAHEVAMQIAATSPKFVSDADIGTEAMAEMTAELRHQAEAENAAAAKPKPPQVIEKMVEGRMAKWLDASVLMRQPYIRDPEKKFGQVITEAIARIGENIVVRRFARFELDEQVGPDEQA